MGIMTQRFLWPDALPDANSPPLSSLRTGWEYQKVNPQADPRLASISRVGCGWKKLRVVGYFDKVALRLKGKVYGACVGSSMIYGSEIWTVNAEQEAKLERAEMRMV